MVNMNLKRLVMKKSILTIKWGSEFTSQHVNILLRAAEDNCKTDFQFVCLTDDASGLDDKIITLPIPLVDLSKMPKSEGAWPKICLFHPSLSNYLEQVLFLDIDTIICGNIDPFFDDPEDELWLLSCGLRWRNFDSALPTHPATGVMSYNVGFHKNVFENFANNPEAAYRHHTVEQQFVGANATKINYFPLEYIQSFKYHLRRQYVLDLLLPPKKPSEETRMVAFHGYPRPSQVATVGEKWARFPRSGIHRPGWLINYWKYYSV